MKLLKFSAFVAAWAIALPQLLNAQSSARAQGPATVISVKSYEALKDSWSYVADLAGQPQMAGALDGIIAMYTGGRGLSGVDTKKPFGVALFASDADQPLPLVFLPVTNEAEFGATIKALPPMVKHLLGGHPGQRVDSWFALGPALAAIDKADLPTFDRLLRPESSRHVLSITTSFDALSEKLKKESLANMERVVSQRRPGESKAQFRTRQMGADAARRVTEVLLDDADEAGFGMTLSSQRQALIVEFFMSPRSGSGLSDVVKSMSHRPSRFAALAEKAALVNFVVNTPLPQEAQQQILASLPAPPARSDALFNATGAGGGDALEDEFLSLLRPTIEAGHVELFVSLQGTPPSPLTLTAGVQAVNAKEIEAFLIELGETAADEGGVGFRGNIAKFQGASIHEVQFVNIDAEEEQFFGTRPKLYFAATDSGLLVAYGADSLKKLKKNLAGAKSVSSSRRQFSPLLFEARVQPWLELFGQDDDTIAAMARKVSPAERVQFDVTSNGNRLGAKLIVQDGLLRTVFNEAAKSRR